MLNKILLLLLFLYRFLFLRKRFFWFNKLLYKLSLRGIGVLNYETDTLSGEKYFLNLFRHNISLVVLDIGANIGEYSEKIKQLNHNANIYAFEPHPKTFILLSKSAEKWGYVAINVAIGDKIDRLTLYDYAKSNGSQHASLYKDVFEDLHQAETISFEVDVLTVDEFVKRTNIAKIDLLKIDVEGNEYKVLLGAKQTIERGNIDLIHFEFNEMNVVSRSFFKDFYDFLDEYEFYRMLPDGLVALKEYDAKNVEIFAYQNIVAVRNSSKYVNIY